MTRLETCLEGLGISYESGASDRERGGADIADCARQFTVKVECLVM